MTGPVPTIEANGDTDDVTMYVKDECACRGRDHEKPECPKHVTTETDEREMEEQR